MKQSIHTKKARLKLLLGMIITLLLGMHSVNSLLRLTQLSVPFSLLFFILCLAFICFVAAFKMFEQLTECILITDDELVAYVFFHRNKSIRWDEIEEIGIGQVFTPVGIQFCVYFSNSPLSFEEVDNLDLAGKKCIYLRTLTRKNYESVCRYCPEEEMVIIRKWVQPE